MSATTGTTVVVGMPKITDTITFSPFPLIRYERILTGAFMGSAQLQMEIPRMIALYKAGKLKLNELITGRFPLEKINDYGYVVAAGLLRHVIVLVNSTEPSVNNKGGFATMKPAPIVFISFPRIKENLRQKGTANSSPHNY